MANQPISVFGTRSGEPTVGVLDGWEATRRIKADPAFGNPPIIALTAHAMPGDEERARAAGCDAVLTKPIDETVLFETLENHLGGDREG